MMGRRRRDQAKLFYEFRLDDRIPKNHLLRRIAVFVTAALADLHKELEPYYSDIGRPSVDPELMIRMLIVGYCYGIRSERRLTQEVELHLAYRWFAIGFSASHPNWSYRPNPEESHPNASVLCDTTPSLFKAHVAGGSMGGAREKQLSWRLTMGRE